MKSKYKRVIVKFSGEILRDAGTGEVLSMPVLMALCNEIKAIHDDGVALGVVIGGGNIFRGVAGNDKFGYDRVVGDHMGMLATIINAMAVADVLRKSNVPVSVFSSMPMPNICDTYFPRHVGAVMDSGNVVILSGGTGSAFFSTDSAAALRANELHADVVVKATKVDGVYDKDPKIFYDAVKYSKLTFSDVLMRRLHVMDSTAFSLCMDNDIPIIVVGAENDLNNISRVLSGEPVGTLISNE